MRVLLAVMLSGLVTAANAADPTLSSLLRDGFEIKAVDMTHLFAVVVQRGNEAYYCFRRDDIAQHALHPGIASALSTSPCASLVDPPAVPPPRR